MAKLLRDSRVLESFVGAAIVALESFVGAAIVAAVAACSYGDTIVIVSGERAIAISNEAGGLKVSELSAPVTVVDLGGEEPPIEPTDDLKGTVTASVKSINDMARAEAIAAVLDLLADQLESDKVKASKFEFGNAVNSAVKLAYTGSEKSTAWATAWAKWWKFVETADAEGKIKTVKDIAPYLREMIAGIEAGMGAKSVNVLTTTDGPFVGTQPHFIDIKSLLELILTIFKLLQDLGIFG
jgi:hypothetical protein